MIPVLVHLFSFRKVNKILFPTLKFITRINSESKSKTRFKHILILITRFISFASLLIILYFHFQNRVDEESEIRMASLLVDSSVSMSIAYDEGTAAETAKTFQSKLDDTFNHFDVDDELLTNVDFNENFDPLLKSAQYVISDFQGVPISSFSPVLTDTSINRYFIVAGNINDARNISVDSLYIEINAEDLSQRKLSVILAKSAGITNENIVIRLIHEGRQLSSIVGDISQLTKIDFDIPVIYKGRFSIEIGGDEVLYDNSFLFVIDHLRKPSVVLIDADENLYLNRLFDNSGLFELVNMNASSIDFAAVENFDVVILNELSSFPSGLEALIHGKTIIAYPSPEMEGNLYEPMGILTKPNDTRNRFEVELDYNLPIFSGVFEKKNENGNLPTSVSLYELSGDFESLISLRNGDPFMVKSFKRDFYFFNTALRNDFSNIASHAIFVPLLYQIVLSTVDYGSKSYYYPGDLLFIEVQDKESPPRIIAKNFEVIPEFNPTDQGIALKIPSEVDAGYYSILHKDDTIQQLAINIPKIESVMKAPTIKDLQEYFKDHEHVYVQSLEHAENLFVDENARADVWKYVLILTILVLLTETLFHRYIR